MPDPAPAGELEQRMAAAAAALADADQRRAAAMTAIEQLAREADGTGMKRARIARELGVSRLTIYRLLGEA